MGTTAHYGIPYPEPSQPPNGPTQMQALATKTDDVLYAHATAGDPHAQYLTQAEGDARYVQDAEVETAVRSPLAGAVITWGENSHTIGNAIPVGSASAAFSVALPAGAFSQAPNVVCTLSTTVGGTAGLVARLTNVTKTSFDVVYYNLGSVTIVAGTVGRIMWQAVGY